MLESGPAVLLPDAHAGGVARATAVAAMIRDAIGAGQLRRAIALIDRLPAEEWLEVGCSGPDRREHLQ